MSNTGHGHVTPRPDGARARCGGPHICITCMAEQAEKNMAELIAARKLAEKLSGFEPDPDGPVDRCRDPGHAAPGHLVVPAGQRYRHVCQTCGHLEFIRASGATL